MSSRAVGTCTDSGGGAQLRKACSKAAGFAERLSTGIGTSGGRVLAGAAMRARSCTGGGGVERREVAVRAEEEVMRARSCTGGAGVERRAAGADSAGAGTDRRCVTSGRMAVSPVADSGALWAATSRGCSSIRMSLVPRSSVRCSAATMTVRADSGAVLVVGGGLTVALAVVDGGGVRTGGDAGAAGGGAERAGALAWVAVAAPPSAAAGGADAVGRGGADAVGRGGANEGRLATSAIGASDGATARGASRISAAATMLVDESRRAGAGSGAALTGSFAADGSATGAAFTADEGAAGDAEGAAPGGGATEPPVVAAFAAEPTRGVAADAPGAAAAPLGEAALLVPPCVDAVVLVVLVAGTVGALVCPCVAARGATFAASGLAAGAARALVAGAVVAGAVVAGLAGTAAFVPAPLEASSGAGLAGAAGPAPTLLVSFARALGIAGGGLLQGLDAPPPPLGRGAGGRIDGDVRTAAADGPTAGGDVLAPSARLPPATGAPASVLVAPGSGFVTFVQAYTVNAGRARGSRRDPPSPSPRHPLLPSSASPFSMRSR